MINHKEFLGSQADRNAQLHHASEQQIAHDGCSEARLGPVFGPLLAKIGDGLVAAGTRLQGHYADLQADSAAPAAPRALAQPDVCGS